MLRPKRSSWQHVLLLTLGASIGVLCTLSSFFAPTEETSYVSHDDTVTDFTTARPSALGDRCYQETTGTALCATGQTCIETGRTPWWDTQRGPYIVIPMKAVHTSLCTCHTNGCAATNSAAESI